MFYLKRNKADRWNKYCIFQIDWLQLVHDLFKNTDITFEYSESIVVREMDFLFNLVKLIEDTPIKVIGKL